MNNKGYEFNFAWLFAILIGIAVLAFAFYAVSSLIDLKQEEGEAIKARQISALLNPVQTNLESSKFTRLIVKEKTVLINDCEENSASEPFGKQILSTILLSKPSKKTPEEPGVEVVSRNKYLFSNSSSTAEDEYYIFSKPLNLPFKVADLLYLWSDEEHYCFINPFSEIEKDINELGLKNIHNQTACSSYPNALKVCFGSSVPSGCDIKVKNPSSNGVIEVDKGTKRTYAMDLKDIDRNNPYPLVYAAIFSEKDIYDCQLKRILSRSSKLADLYANKSRVLTSYGCSSPIIQTSLEDYKNSLDPLTLPLLLNKAQQLQ